MKIIWREERNLCGGSTHSRMKRWPDALFNLSLYLLHIRFFASTKTNEGLCLSTLGINICLNLAVWEDVFINLKPDPLSPPMNPNPSAAAA
jgi:hypothetical protein